jgi:hypothetical protein
MELHYLSLKKLIESIHYGESLSYYLGKTKESEQKEIVKMIKKIAKKNFIEVHIRWTEDKETVRIIEKF